jgi:hypothetical protein
MTISTSTSRNDYNAVAQTTFPYTFKIFDATHLKVYSGGVLKTLNVDYTVTNVGADGGGNVVFGAPQTALIAILRVVPITQLTDYVENDPFPAETHEGALDKLTMIGQQLSEKQNRTLALSDSSPLTSITLPDPIVGGELFRWKTDKTGIELIASGSLAVGILSPIVAQGDLVQGGSGAIPERLAVGATGQFLTVAAGKAAWATLGITLTNKTGGSLVAGDVVAFDTANDSAVALGDTVGSFKPFVVALASINNNASGLFSLPDTVVSGVAAQGSIARGEYVRKSATSKKVEGTGVLYANTQIPPSDSLGWALTAAAAGVVTVSFHGRPPALAAYGQCRLTKSGANLQLAAYNGTWLTFPNGVHANVATVTLGTGGLGASTLYYIYAVQTAGVVTSIEASTTSYLVDAATGPPYKNGDTSRVLVGLGRTTAGTAWADTDAQRFVISYFNRRTIRGRNAFTADRSTASTTVVEVNSEIRAEFLTWGDEAVGAAITGSAVNNTGFTSSTGIGFDGTTIEVQVSHIQAGAGGAIPLGLSTTKDLSEGYHYATLLGYTTGGTETWQSADANITSKCRTTVTIRG